MFECTGYHGTLYTQANKIVSSKKFDKSCSDKVTLTELINNKNSTYHWLGDGIYFWINDFDQAKFWAEGKLKKMQVDDKTCIIKAPIKVEDEKLYNICQKENLEEVSVLIETVLLDGGNDIVFDHLHYKKKYECVGWACDIIDEHTNHCYDAFVYGFNIPSKKNLLIDNITPQICIKNEEVIDMENIKIIKVR